MTTFTALGDSITLGVGDPVPLDGRRAWRGWAALLAEGLNEPRLHVLASCGARIPDVERYQLPAALQLRPEIASFVVGVNDTLRASFDIAQVAAAAAHTVGALRSAGAEVLTMRLPDPGQMLGLPGSLARPLARRMHEVNAVLDGLAERFGTLHFDAAADPEVFDPQMWAVDRLHPNERGHRFIARSFHELMRGAGLPVGSAPGAEPVNAPPSRWAEFTWLARRQANSVIGVGAVVVVRATVVGLKAIGARRAGTGNRRTVLILLRLRLRGAIAIWFLCRRILRGRTAGVGMGFGSRSGLLLPLRRPVGMRLRGHGSGE